MRILCSLSFETKLKNITLPLNRLDEIINDILKNDPSYTYTKREEGEELVIVFTKHKTPFPPDDTYVIKNVITDYVKYKIEYVNDAWKKINRCLYRYYLKKRGIKLLLAECVKDYFNSPDCLPASSLREKAFNSGCQVNEMF